MVPKRIQVVAIDSPPAVFWSQPRRPARQRPNADGSQIGSESESCCSDASDDAGAEAEGEQDEEDLFGQLLDEAVEAEASNGAAVVLFDAPAPADVPEAAGEAEGVAQAAAADEARQAAAPGAVPGAPVAPPAPVPPPPMQGAGRRRRGQATTELVVDGGAIQFYQKDNRFTATCWNEFHGSCVLTRYNTRGSGMQGRPLALMAAWLSRAPMYDTKEEHWQLVREFSTDKELLRAFRQELLANPEAAAMLAHERPLGPGEGSELP